MRLSSSVLNCCVSIAMAMVGAPGAWAAVHECAAVNPTGSSYTWNFKSEANTIFGDIHSEARQAANHADTLAGFERAHVSWQTDGGQLQAIKSDVNDIGENLCRLETIRPDLAPWQQHEVDRIAGNVMLMADNTQDAIVFGNDHQSDLWMPAFHKYTGNIFSEAKAVSQSTQNAMNYAGVTQEYRMLRQKMRV